MIKNITLSLFFVLSIFFSSSIIAQCSNFTLGATIAVGACDPITNMVSVTIDYSATFSSGNASWQWSYTVYNSNGTSATVLGPVLSTNSSNSESVSFSMFCDSSVEAGIHAWSAPNAGGNYCGYTIFGTASLPVIWGNVTAVNERSQNTILWSTENEINNELFEIQHSYDGKEFRSIGAVLGSGTTSTSTKYEYVDENPNGSTNYYRIKQIDFDGNFDFSKVVVARTNFYSEYQLEFAPNPVQDELRLLNLSGDVDWEIRTTNGRVVDNGQSQKINVSGLSPGTYLISIVSDDTRHTKRFIKI